MLSANSPSATVCPTGSSRNPAGRHGAPLDRVPGLSSRGAQLIRKDHICTFMLVTDFVGSGNRVWTYIEAAGRVWSIKSLHSRGMLRFEIVAYSGTEKGR